MKNRYTYKFSDGGYDYYRDNATDLIVKLPEDTPRTDDWMSKNAIDAEGDEAVYEFYS